MLVSCSPALCALLALDPAPPAPPAHLNRAAALAPNPLQVHPNLAISSKAMDVSRLPLPALVVTQLCTIGCWSPASTACAQCGRLPCLPLCPPAFSIPLVTTDSWPRERQPTEHTAAALLSSPHHPACYSPSPLFVVQVMHDLMTDCFEQLAEEAGNLTRMARHATLTAREVQVRFVPQAVAGVCTTKRSELC